MELNRRNMKKICSFFAAAVWVFSVHLSAAERPKEEIRETKSIKYRLVYPVDYDGTKSYPVLISFHGAAPEKPLDEKTDANIGPFLPKEIQEEYLCFVIVPRATRLWWQDEDGDVSEKRSLISELKNELDKKLLKEFPMDKKRIYLIGSSDGGTAIWHALAFYPGYFAGAVPMCGWLSWKIDFKKVIKSRTPV